MTFNIIRNQNASKNIYEYLLVEEPKNQRLNVNKQIESKFVVVDNVLFDRAETYNNGFVNDR